MSPFVREPPKAKKCDFPLDVPLRPPNIGAPVLKNTPKTPTKHGGLAFETKTPSGGGTVLDLYFLPGSGSGCRFEVTHLESTGLMDFNSARARHAALLLFAPGPRGLGAAGLRG